MTTVRAKEAFSYNDVNGVPVIVNPGALFDSNDPDVQKRAHLFEEVQVAAARRKRTLGVEDATAEPGEKRSVSTVPGDTSQEPPPVKTGDEQHPAGPEAASAALTPPATAAQTTAADKRAEAVSRAMNKPHARKNG